MANNEHYIVIAYDSLNEVNQIQKIYASFLKNVEIIAKKLSKEYPVVYAIYPSAEEKGFINPNEAFSRTKENWSSACPF